MTILNKTMYTGLTTQQITVFERPFPDAGDMVTGQILWFEDDDWTTGKKRIVKKHISIEVAEDEMGREFKRVGTNPNHPCHGTYFATVKEALAALQIEADKIFAKRRALTGDGIDPARQQMAMALTDEDWGEEA